MELYEEYKKIVETFWTNIDVSYTIDRSEVLFLYGLFVVFVLAYIGFFMAVHQSPVKKQRLRVWVN